MDQATAAKLKEDFKKGRADIAARLEKLDPDAMPLSSLGKHQVKGLKIRNAIGTMTETGLAGYADLQQSLFEFRGIGPKEFTLVDYGGGLGLSAMLAKYIGVGTIVYNDIHDASCKDAQLLAEACGLKADHYVTGGVDELVEFSRTSGIKFNGLVSYDVLEHIFDLDDFFDKVRNICDAELTISMGTGANPHNPKIRKREVAKAVHAEFNDTPKKWMEGHRDTESSYLKSRRKIVHEFAPQLTQAQVETLATATRGYIKPQIEAATAEFVKSGKVTLTPDHPTNTCCPYTGFWHERLVTREQYEALLKKYGYEGVVRPGKYAGPRIGAVRMVFNMMIDAMGSPMLCIAPYTHLLATYRRRSG
jgi:hypothetical protein